MGSRKNWLSVRLEGVKSNRQALGARIAVLCAGQKPIWRRVHTDSSYLSASDPRVHFGLGDDRGPVTVLVVWPDGSRETWEGVRAGAFVSLRQGSGRPAQ